MHVALGPAYGVARSRGGDPHRAGKSGYELFGRSRHIKELHRQLAEYAPTDLPVLISGESGRGKELVARVLHYKSPRAGQPFIVANCGAVVGQVQSDIFADEKSVSVGPPQYEEGFIEAASKGTLFLDEIDHLPLAQQANLVRFLQEKQSERACSHRSALADVRVLAATHADLEGAIRRGRFRKDLYDRLGLVHIQTPALRECVSDIPELAAHFAKACAATIGRRSRCFSEAALTAMIQHPWPGNVRELANRVRRGLMLAEGR